MVPSNIAAARPNLGQSIYFLYSVQAKRAHMCRAWAIHASKVIRPVCLWTGEIPVVKIWLRMQYNEVFIPFSMFNQNCCNCSMNGFSVSTSKTADLLQKAGPILPKRVGHMPWIVQMPFCDGNKQTLCFLSSIHSRQLVIGQRCVNINTSNSSLLFCTNSTSFNSKLFERRSEKKERLRAMQGDVKLEKNCCYFNWIQMNIILWARMLITSACFAFSNE